MTGFFLSLFALLMNFVLIIILVAQYYQSRIDAARDETEMWKRKAGGLDQGAE